MKFNDLVERLGVPSRQVRYMIAEGLIPEALEVGRHADAWDEEHVRRGLRAIELQERGFPLSAIRLLLHGEAALPLIRTGPVALSVDATVNPDSIDIDATLAEIASALRRYVNPSQE